MHAADWQKDVKALKKYLSPTAYANMDRNEAITEAVCVLGGVLPGCLQRSSVDDDSGPDYVPERHKSSERKEIKYGAMREKGRAALKNICSEDNTAALFAAQKYPAWYCRQRSNC